MSPASILVVDADMEARNRAAAGLRELGHDVDESGSAGHALEAVRQQRPDLIVIEWTLPDSGGLAVLSEVKQVADAKPVRVVMTSGRGDPDDVVSALESGADDFIGKPFSMREFIARIGACLRRPASPHNGAELSAGGIIVDCVGHRVAVDGRYLSLAPREYRLLEFFIGNQDRVFSRRQLLLHVWDRDGHVGARTVDVHVRRLRSLLEPHGYDRYLQTVRGSGYRFSLEG